MIVSGVPPNVLPVPGLTVTTVGIGGETSRAYGVLKDFKLVKMASRQSFIVSPDGTVVKHYEKVDPDNHTQQVLADIEAMMDAG